MTLTTNNLCDITRLWVLDIETTFEHDKIHCVCVRSLSSKAILTFTDRASFNAFLLKDRREFIGHNIIGFDAPILLKVWNIDIVVYMDTLVMSRLYDPAMEGGHSLAAWGERLQIPKLSAVTEQEGFFINQNPKEMEEYCRQDTKVTEALFMRLRRLLSSENFSEKSIVLEHQVAALIQEQKENGFQLDARLAEVLVEEWEDERASLEKELVDTMEPTVKVLKTKIKNIPFNPGSRDQIADRLIRRGWVPKTFTPTGKPVVDDEVLETVDIPAAKQIHRYMLLQKRITQVRSWLESMDENGLVHGSIISNGAVTGRMTHHSPNMAQVPASYSPLGKECRSCWTVSKEGWTLVGIDADGLELRMLAHYMNDPDVTAAVISGKKEDGTDIHTLNMKAAGLPDRDTAKTFIYAFLYGAGAAKIGSIVGGGEREGRKLIDKFLSNYPKLGNLKERIINIVNKTSTLPGLDGRRLRIRSPHSALNTLLQGAGAIVMKEALVLFKLRLVARHIPHRFVANVHDEWQLECPEVYADEVGSMGADAIAAAGRSFSLRCPLAGSYSIGNTWAETH